MRKTLTQALCAAFCAILACATPEGGGVMRLAMRNIFFDDGGAETPTAKDYVHDGLIAMWDGIENAGWGVHVPAASETVNLVGGAIGNMKLAGNFAILRNGIRLNQNVTNQSSGSCIGTAAIQGSISGLRTYEFAIGENVINMNSVSSSRPKPYYTSWLVSSTTAPNSAPCLYISPSGVAYGREIYPGLGMYNSAGFDSGIPKPDQNSIRVDQSATVKTLGYIGGNGVASEEFALFNGTRMLTNLGASTTPYISTSGTLQFFNRISDYCRPLNGVVFRVSIYNRALTAAEVAANRAVDVARFNLPTA